MEEFTIQQAKLSIGEAREAIQYYLKSGKVTRAKLPEEIDKPVGVFVTLKKHNKNGERLRGCIGFPEPIYELSRGLTKAAVSAAFADPRFPPVEEDELPHISLEISILSQPQLVDVPKQEIPASIEVGKHGIIIERGFNRGLLLPQVAVEEGCDSEGFLALGCLKAGLSPDSWLTKNVNVYIFTAKVFKEVEPMGEVVEEELGSL
jgi:hypothetical protein